MGSPSTRVSGLTLLTISLWRAVHLVLLLSSWFNHEVLDAMQLGIKHLYIGRETVGGRLRHGILITILINIWMSIMQLGWSPFYLTWNRTFSISQDTSQDIVDISQDMLSTFQHTLSISQGVLGCYDISLFRFLCACVYVRVMEVRCLVGRARLATNMVLKYFNLTDSTPGPSAKLNPSCYSSTVTQSCQLVRGMSYT